MTDVEYMQRALALAEEGRGRTSPNPMVGCVIVRDGLIVGEGYHRKAGEPHAEIEAIRDAGTQAEGAEFFVTLEPCSHTGRTGPCVDALIPLRPTRVVVALTDPNPLVNGNGIAQLRDAGIPVEVGVCEREAERQNEAFVTSIRRGRPFVIAKCAMTLDGKIATRTGHSRWVTGEAARQKVHQLRNEVDGILVGSRTVMLDDPSLTTRLPDAEKRDPVRIILDAEQYLDRGRRVFHVDSHAPTWVAVSQKRDYPWADEVIEVAPGAGGVDMVSLMLELGQRGIQSLLIEGGGTTHAAAFEAGVVDKVVFFIAPKIIGGREAVSAVEGEGVETMEEAIALTSFDITRCGEDLLVEAYVARDAHGEMRRCGPEHEEAHVYGNH